MDFVTENYRDHVLFVHVYKSTEKPFRYVANFIASMNGVPAAGATIDREFDSAIVAKEGALQIAKECVDEILFA